MIKIEKIWDVHLKYLNEQNRLNRYEGNEQWFSASSAGNCYKKHLFKVLGFKELPNTPVQERLFDAGNHLHSSIQTAMSHVLNEKKMAKDVRVVHEYQLEIPELNVRGFCDSIVFNSTMDFKGKKIKVTEILDYKSMKAYSWKLKFGRTPDTNPNGLNELQLSTYALALKNKRDKNEVILIDGEYYEIHTIVMRLMYYKKDDSMVRVLEVPPANVQRAIQYWEELNAFIENCTVKENKMRILVAPDLAKTGGYGMPFFKWECNYCNYHCYCNNNGTTKSCKVPIPKGWAVPIKI